VGVTYAYTIAANGCSNIQNISVTINPLPSAAGTITGTSTLNGGTTGVAYSVPAITNAVSYIWAYSGTGVTIAGGTTNNITIDFAINASSGNLTVKGMNACGNGTVSLNFPITVNILPGTPGTITGTASLCQGAVGVTYTVPAITNATGYVWTLPFGASITGGSNTRTITVTFSSTASSGNVSVHGTNVNGNGPESVAFPVTVKPTPVTGPLYHKRNN